MKTRTNKCVSDLYAFSDGETTFMFGRVKDIFLILKHPNSKPHGAARPYAPGMIDDGKRV